MGEGWSAVVAEKSRCRLPPVQRWVSALHVPKQGGTPGGRDGGARGGAGGWSGAGGWGGEGEGGAGEGGTGGGGEGGGLRTSQLRSSIVAFGSKLAAWGAMQP